MMNLDGKKEEWSPVRRTEFTVSMLIPCKEEAAHCYEMHFTLSKVLLKHDGWLLDQLEGFFFHVLCCLFT